MLVVAALHASDRGIEFQDSIKQAESYIEAEGGIDGLRKRYGKDKTFAVPILANCAMSTKVKFVCRGRCGQISLHRPNTFFVLAKVYLDTPKQVLFLPSSASRGQTTLLPLLRARLRARSARKSVVWASRGRA